MNLYKWYSLIPRFTGDVPLLYADDVFWYCWTPKANQHLREWLRDMTSSSKLRQNKICCIQVEKKLLEQKSWFTNLHQLKFHHRITILSCYFLGVSLGNHQQTKDLITVQCSLLKFENLSYQLYFEIFGANVLRFGWLKGINIFNKKNSYLHVNVF